MSLTRLLHYTLPLCMLGTLLFLVFDLQAGGWLARIALLLYLLVQWPRQTRMAKGILLVVIAMAAVVVWRDAQPVPILLGALDRLCFFATFVSSLGLLRVSAMRSRLVREAELHADEDAQRKDLVEAKNQADSATYQAEKTLQEHGERTIGKGNNEHHFPCGS